MALIFNADKVREPIYAVVPYFNPWRWKSRVKHTQRALKHFHESGAVVVLVEIGFNRRDLVFADSGLDGTAANCEIHGVEFRHKYIGLHTKDELWLKENAINIGVQNLPHNWEQVCWLDSDIHFLRPNWVGEAIQKLQHYAFLQMFSHARDLGPNHEMLPQAGNNEPMAGMAFFRAWRDKLLYKDLQDVSADLDRLRIDFDKLSQDVKDAITCYPSIGPTWPGLAWACTRQAWNDVGGLFDVSVWGGSDYDMAHALIERAAYIHPNAHENYRRLLLEWEHRCRRHIRRNVGVMEGSVVHSWHGRKRDRKYTDKRVLMNETSFDPLRFLKRDGQGLWQLHDDGSDNFVHFRDQMRRIAKERNEDSIDL